MDLRIEYKNLNIKYRELKTRYLELETSIEINEQYINRTRIILLDKNIGTTVDNKKKLIRKIINYFHNIMIKKNVVFHTHEHYWISLSKLNMNLLNLLKELIVTNELTILDRLDIYNMYFLQMLSFYFLFNEKEKLADYYMVLSVKINKESTYWLGYLLYYKKKNEIAIIYFALDRKLDKKYRLAGLIYCYGQIIIKKLNNSKEDELLVLNEKEVWYKYIEEAGLIYGHTKFLVLAVVLYFSVKATRRYNFVKDDVTAQQYLELSFKYNNTVSLVSIPDVSDKLKRLLLTTTELEHPTRIDLKMLEEEYDILDIQIKNMEIKLNELLYMPGGLGYLECKSRFEKINQL